MVCAPRRWAAFACETAEAGATAIRAAMAELKAEGFEAVLGPMDGDTWGKHRLVIESDGRPPFLMEPHNPPHYVDAFEPVGPENRLAVSVGGSTGGGAAK